MNMHKVCFFVLPAVMAISVVSCSSDKIESKAPVNVQVERVKSAEGGGSIAYNGTIEESEKIPLNFMVIGSVSRVLVSEGDLVRKGQLLATLDEENYKSTYEMAVATQKQAEDAYNRLEPIYKNGNLPEIKFVETETNLQKAKSQAAIAKKNYDDCKLCASADGVIGKRLIEPGMNVVPNATSIEIVKINKVFAIVSIPENEFGLMKRGLKCTVSVGALGGQEFPGTIEEIGVLADPIVHTYKMKVGIANSALKLTPGMICNVTVTGTGTRQSLVVPGRSLLVDEAGRNFVFVVDSSTMQASRRFVTTGRLLQYGTEIAGGLAEGELVVVAGQHKLADRSPVAIVHE